MAVSDVTLWRVPVLAVQRYLTALQIAQFVLDVAVITYCSWVLYVGGDHPLPPPPPLFHV